MQTKRLSGLQRDVLVLYKNLLISAKKKSNSSNTFYNFVRSEFREKAFSIDKTDFKLIEYSLRQGYKQKKLMDMPGFSSASFNIVKHPDIGDA